MSNNILLRQLLIDEESIDLDAHLVKGVWHVGIGHNLEIGQTAEETAILGKYEDPSSVSITEKQAHDLFDIDVGDAVEDIYPTWTEEDLDGLGETRRAIILSMAFQLGGGGIRKFKDFIKEIKNENFENASKEMLYADVETKRPSAWYRQTPDRCQRASDAMKLGYFKRYANLTPKPEQQSMQERDFADTTTEELFAEINMLLAEIQKRTDAS